jgi:hypothetical protein
LAREQVAIAAEQRQKLFEQSAHGGAVQVELIQL